MWTPAIERDRRIALQARATRFFGTDFTCDDLEQPDVDQHDGNENFDQRESSASAHAGQHMASARETIVELFRPASHLPA